MKVLAMHDKEGFPELNEAEAKGLQEKMTEVLESHPGVRYKDTWVNGDGYGICIWEGPNAQAVRAAIEEIVGGEYPDRIVGVKE